MNRFFIGLVAIFLIFASCKKDEDNADSPTQPTLNLTSSKVPFTLTTGGKFYQTVS